MARVAKPVIAAIAAVEGSTQQKRLEAKSADYLVMESHWTKVNDILAGEDAMIKASERYLPMYPDEQTAEYKFRKECAKFTNVFRDITEALASKPFEQEITFRDDDVDNQSVKPTPELEEFADDVDGSGNNITIFAMDTFFSGIAYSMDWIFVDYPPVAAGAPLRTVADEKALGLRPYWTHVSCLNVYEIKSRMINGREVFTYFRIYEPSANGNEEQYREMFHDPATGTASFKIWRWSEAAKDFVQSDTGPITIGIIPMVPFVTGRRNGKSWQNYPPMKDAADLQIKLYRAESNLEVTKTFAAFPMLVGQGVKPERVSEQPGAAIKKQIIGPGITLYAPHTGQGAATDWHWIAPDAAILAWLSTDVKDTTQQLREQGRQPLTVSSGNLTVITTAVAAGKAKSAVKAWATGLADALTLACYYTALWFGQSEGPSVHVFDEFDEFTGDGKDMDQLISMAGSNKLSDETLWEEAQRRKLLSSEFDPVREKERLLAQVPNDPGFDNQEPGNPLNPNDPTNPKPKGF